MAYFCTFLHKIFDGGVCLPAGDNLCDIKVCSPLLQRASSASRLRVLCERKNSFDEDYNFY
jgi:hypothetical protein